MPPFDQIQTPRLRLRRLTPADAEPLATYRALPEVMRWQLWDHYDLETARILISTVNLVQPFAPASAYQFAVELSATAQLIGDLYFKTDDAGTQAEIGWTFSPDFQGRGLATEAAHALIDHAFRNLGYHRIYAITDPRHTQSMRLMTRLGMRQEAHFRQNLWFKSAWADDVHFAVLAQDWS